MPINTNFWGVDSTKVCGRSGATGLYWGGGWQEQSNWLVQILVQICTIWYSILVQICTNMVWYDGGTSLSDIPPLCCVMLCYYMAICLLKLSYTLKCD